MKPPNRRKILKVTFVIIVLGVLGYLLLDSKKRSFNGANQTSPESIATAGSNSMATSKANTLPAAPAAAAAMTSPPTNVHGNSPPPPAPETELLPPATVLDNARVAIHNYLDRFGENPVGDNSEITAALMGKNPKSVNFITAESGLRVNGQGEMIDAWGTPFFFHQISGKLMEIHSAGPDRKLWTFDDSVTR